MAKRFFHVAAGVLALALAFHLVTRAAAAQSNPKGPSSPIVAATFILRPERGGLGDMLTVYALASDGDIYEQKCQLIEGVANRGGQWRGAARLVNFWSAKGLVEMNTPWPQVDSTGTR
jgi:hypothetical protein